MGVFDTLTFDYRVPDGTQALEWQTKALGCTLDGFEITMDGRLTRVWCSGCRDDEGNRERPLGDVLYDGPLNISGDGRDYLLMFVRGLLMDIWCEQTKSRLVFEPVANDKLIQA